MERNRDKSIVMLISRQNTKKSYGSKTRKKHKSQERKLGEQGEPSEFIYVEFENVKNTLVGMATGVLA